MKKLLLSIVIILASGALWAQDCSQLFFSEYVEGSANNKTLEIYNPTNSAVDLSQYVINRYSNGNPLPDQPGLPLSGTLQPKDALVVTNGQTDSVWVENGQYWSLPISEELYNLGDFHCSGIYPTPMYFNGNDAMTLETLTGDVIDIFGKIGEDPGANGWNDIPPAYTAGTQYWTSWTVDQTLIRKHSVKAGITSNPALFMVNVEWDSIPKDTWDSLGFHHCDCGSTGIFEKPAKVHSFVIYPNPTLGNTLRIDASASWTRVELQNVTGQVVRSEEFPAATRQGAFDITGLAQGVYLVRILFTDQTVAIEKVVKR